MICEDSQALYPATAAAWNQMKQLFDITLGRPFHVLRWQKTII